MNHEPIGEHPENPEWMNELVREIRETPVGKIRCRSCDEMVVINGAFLDILVMRGVSSIEKCSQCRQADAAY